MRIRTLSLTLLLAVWGTNCLAQQSVVKTLKEGGKLTIAYRENSMPFSYLDDKQKPVGYAMDLCLKIAESVGRKIGIKSVPLALVPVTSANRIDFIAEGKAQMECGSTTNNAARRKRVAFTIPHFITGARLLVRADTNITRIEDLEGKKLVSTNGSTPLQAVMQANRERLLRINILEAADHRKGVEMVEAGQADAFVMDDVLLFALAAERPDPSKLKVVGKFVTTEALAIMLPKDDVEFKKMVDDEMRRLIQSGEIHVIYDKWFSKPIPPKNVNLNMQESYILKDFWKYPTDFVPT